MSLKDSTRIPEDFSGSIKTLSIALVVVIGTVAGCGGDYSSCPAGQIENDQGVCVDIPECWGDNDCPAQHACVDFQCVLHPECEVDEDCNGGTQGPLMCTEDKICTPYIDGDLCAGKRCSEECSECGPLTSCGPTGICTDACVLWTQLDMQASADACDLTEVHCLFCVCANNYQEAVSIDPTRCEDPAVCRERDQTCWRARAEAKKEQLNTIIWDDVVENRTNYCIDNPCS